MKKLKFAFIGAAIICMAAGVCFAKAWYEGGTLHKSSVKQFLNSDYDNGRATVADWVVTTMSDAELEKVPELKLKHGVEDVYECMETAGKDNAVVANSRATELAVMCMAQLKKKYPWMLTKE